MPDNNEVARFRIPDHTPRTFFPDIEKVREIEALLRGECSASAMLRAELYIGRALFSHSESFRLLVASARRAWAGLRPTANRLHIGIRETRDRMKKCIAAARHLAL